MTFLVLALAGGAFVVWLYRAREVPVGGRRLLATARVLALTLVALLLWNPTVPGASDSTAGARPWLLLDGSLSMAAAAEGRSTPWEDALERIRGGEWGGILLFGDEPTSVESDELSSLGPDAPRSRLEPALERAAEGGARRVVVISDGRIEGAREGLERAGALGLRVDVEFLESGVVNAGIAELALPARVDSGAGVEASAVVFAQGLEETDSLALEVREEGRLVASRRVPAPARGRLGRVELTLPPPEGTGFRRYWATVSAVDDGFPDDDGRPAWIEVDPDEGGVALVSFRPDWEPRFLLPVLERVSGLRGEGFLAVGEGRFMTTAGGPAGPRMVETAEVRRQIDGARIVVIHGLGAGAPAWVERAADEASALIVFPLDPAGAGLTGLPVGSPLSGEWYPATPLPASPLAGALAGADLSRLPPLELVLPLGGEMEVAVPLNLQRQGRGATEAALALLEAEDARRVVVLGRGLWRWGFREGSGREVYRRLWAGVAGWLLTESSVASGPDVAPLERILSRGEPIPWRAPAPAGDSVRIRVTARSGDAPVTDTVVSFGSGPVWTPALPPGEYAYVALESEGGTVGQGRFDVESYTGELLLQVAELPEEATPRAGEAFDRTSGRPLRTHPLPYLVVLGLLCAEWVGRRRKGLR